MNKHKYKIGDLVTLSAAGKKRDGNHNVQRGFGIVVELLNPRHHRWPIRTQWVGGDTSNLGFKPYELKKFKAVKKCP